MLDKKILVIEDDLSLAGALIAKLDLEGFVTMSAKNGEEGLELALSNHPDLILLDIIMPKMDGITMLKKLRADSWGKDAPVVILSNLSDADKNIDVVDSSAQAYLIKSDWTLQDVITKVKNILNIV